jgi:tRNA threonylcarbamoyladenosine biosynthesis protein TsaB
MRVLALDTTTRAGSAALLEDDRVIAEREGDPARSHAERLPGDLVELLKDADVPLSSVDLFAVAAGPGSFTGLRIGIATIQGLAFVHSRRIVAVSSLEALAQAAARDLPLGAIVGAWMDAHRRDVFAALYQVTGARPFTAERLVELDPPTVSEPISTLNRWTHRVMPGVISGDGATMYRAMLEGIGRVMDPRPLAGTIGRMALARARDGAAIDPGAVQPLYVRRPDAEVERERQGRRQVKP